MIDPAVRERTACQYRIRNESRWIKRSLERTFLVAKSVILWDDGSEDNTLAEALSAIVPPTSVEKFLAMPSPIVVEYNDCALHVLKSPFRYHVVRPRQAVNEIRDKNMIHAYCKSSVDFDHMLALDGDEVLTLEAIRNWPDAIMRLQSGIDFLHLPFIYLWDAEDKRRVDGIYGDLPGTVPPYAKLNFPRLFTISRLNEVELFDTCFQWYGTQGGFHCGSLPRQNFRPFGKDPTSERAQLPIAHYGYIDDDLRRRKVDFYRSVDPNNLAEGNYAHCLGEPDIHAPGPLDFTAWKDT